MINSGHADNFTKMKSRFYVETSIPSFYHEVRTEPDMVARQEWTRRLWEDADRVYELLTSVAVIEELENGEFKLSL